MFLSVVIPAHNRRECLPASLGPLAGLDPSDTETIIIDNGSTDGTFEFISVNYPHSRVLRNERNLGAAAARNQGAAVSRGSYVMFLDSDACVSDDFFRSLRKVLSGIPSGVGAVAPKIIDPGTGRIFSCGLRITPLYRVHDIGRGRPAHEYGSTFAVDGANSCCMIIRRECLEEIKSDGEYFRGAFFFMLEDADLSLRLRDKGYTILYAPALLCTHFNAGGNVGREARRFFCFRNRWYMILSREKGLRLARFFIKSFFYDLLRSIHFAFTNRYSLTALKDIYAKFRE